METPLQTPQPIRSAARSPARYVIAALASTIAVLVVTLVAVAVLAQRVRTHAPSVIGEIAAERQQLFESELAARTGEAQQLVMHSFAFMYRLWAENPVLANVRVQVDSAMREVRTLGYEVRAAFSSPLNNFGTLLDHGPTRIQAVLEHALAVARELKHVVPVVLQSLDEATTAFRDADGVTLHTSLATLDGLLNPLMGEHEGLRTDWGNLRVAIVAWSERVDATLTMMRAQISGDSLSTEFSQRLFLRVF